MAASPPRPDFFIVGAPKAGTTALFHYLGQHPDVFVPRVKEPMFFGSDLEFLNSRRRSFEDYLSLFGDAGGARRIGEASTTYLYSEAAPTEIRSFNPGARIIIVLRNPIDVMHAWHGECVVRGVEPIHDFARALEAEPLRRRGEGLPGRRVLRQGLYYRWIVDFACHVSRYLRVFGPSRVHVEVFDDFVADPARCWQRTLAFLELDGSFAPDFTVVNESRRVRSRRLHDFAAEPPALVRAAARASMPERARRGLQYRVLQANTRAAPREPMPAALRASLAAELAPRVAAVGDLLGRDLSAWVAPSAGSLSP